MEKLFSLIVLSIVLVTFQGCSGCSSSGNEVETDQETRVNAPPETEAIRGYEGFSMNPARKTELHAPPEEDVVIKGFCIKSNPDPTCPKQQ